MTEHIVGLEGELNRETQHNLNEDIIKIPLYLVVDNSGSIKDIAKMLRDNSERYGTITNAYGRYIHLISTSEQRDNLHESVKEKEGLFKNINGVIDEDEKGHFE